MVKVAGDGRGSDGPSEASRLVRACRYDRLATLWSLTLYSGEVGQVLA